MRARIEVGFVYRIPSVTKPHRQLEEAPPAKALFSVAEVNRLQPRCKHSHDAHRIGLQICCSQIGAYDAAAGILKGLGNAGELAPRIRGREVEKARYIYFLRPFEQKVKFLEPIDGREKS
jgi:hypothetical protein